MLYIQLRHRLRLFRRHHPKLSIFVILSSLVSALNLSSRKIGLGYGYVPGFANRGTMSYEPNNESLARHEAPRWFHDAKLGIFVHWGLYSVPAWATKGLDFGEMQQTGMNKTDDDGEEWNRWFKHNAYAEWYFNTLRIDGSPTQQYHQNTFGKDFAYDDFVPLFNKAVQRWNPDAMAGLFKDVHAQYVVLTSKHHDGFLMWPSKTLNSRKKGYHAERNIVGELGRAVRQKGMRMGYYYSGGVDWSFNPQLVQKHEEVRAACIQDDAYVDYANAHWRELIDDYDTSVLWNDICYPRRNANADVNELFAYFYNLNPDGVINDRFNQYTTSGVVERENHHDYRTPEYKTFPDIQSNKWEQCRGIGHSFGYNQEEGEEQYLSVQELVYSFVDIVSKNGNLLLNVGPQANGSLPMIQEERLRGLGQWLDQNGEAIFKTRPWHRAEATTEEGIEVRYTQTDDALYAVILGKPYGGEITINELTLPDGTEASLLGYDGTREWKNVKSGVLISMHKGMSEQPAYSIKISPKPK